MKTPQHFGYVEVTVAMALMDAAGHVVNGDMVDVTIAFGIRTPPPPRPLTEAESKETLRVNLGRVTAVIQAMLITNGALDLGQVDEPMTEQSAEVVGRVLSDAVTVRMAPVKEGRA